MTENTALWLPRARAPMAVGPASPPAPGEGEILIRSRAVAVNIIDRLMQTTGHLITPYLTYPAVLGSDVAGEVEAVGPGVTRFAVGDRVVGYAAGSDKSRNSSAEGAFQTRVLLLARMTSPIPDDLSYEQAAVLPLGIATAACGLFQQDHLALDPPRQNAVPKNETLLVWGGSTTVGSNAIQLARASGYEVITTAGPRNFDYVKKLGAQQVFDYHRSSAIENIVTALRGRKVAGAIAIGPGSAEACIEVMARCEGNLFVAQTSTSASLEDIPAGTGHWRTLVPVLLRMVAGNAGIALRARRRGVRTKFIWGSALIGNEVGPMIFEHFLPQALAEHRYRAAPEPVVVGEGLGAIPDALEKRREGVSAAKVVVRL